MTQPSDRPPRDITQLIALARGDDPVAAREALGQLWEVCRPYLLGVANKEWWRASNPGKASPSDAVQETLMKATGAFDQFRGQTEKELLGWLNTTLLRVISDFAEPGKKLRLQGDSPSDPEDGPIDPNPPPDQQVVAGEEDAALYDALARLPAHYRQVVLWRDFDTLPFEEIGRRSGRSAEAARKLWVRAIEQLQQILVPAHDSP